MARLAFPTYPRRCSSSSSTSASLKDGEEDAHMRGGMYRKRCRRGMSPAASCRVDDNFRTKLNTSGMKMHYPSASLAGGGRH